MKTDERAQLKRIESEAKRLLERVRTAIASPLVHHHSRERAAVKRASLDLNVECAKYRRGTY